MTKPILLPLLVLFFALGACLHGPRALVPLHDSSADEAATIERDDSVLVDHPKAMVSPAPHIDVRACTAADGSWHCSAPRPKLYGAGRPPIIPASWTVPAWYIDPANSTTCASDGNSCTSATCGAGGVGPCLTWHEINDGRWGCQGAPANCPRLQQSTTVTALSGVTSASDAVYLRPAVEGAFTFTWQCALPLPAATGTLSGTVPKNRTTGQLLNETLTSGLASRMLIVNTTHPSHASLSTLVSGTTWAITQPQSNPTVPITLPTEVDSWADGDAYSVYSLLPVRFADIEPISTTRNTASGVARIVIQDCQFFNELGASDISAQTIIDESFLDIQDCDIRTAAIIRPSVQPYNNPNWINVSFSSIAMGIATLNTSFWGGQIVGANALFINLSGAGFQNEMIINHAATFINLEAPTNVIGNGGGGLYIGSGKHLNIEFPTVFIGPVWGPGDIRVTLSGYADYLPGAGKAAATFLNSGGITLNRQSSGCIFIPGASTVGACNSPVTVANLDTIFGATTGALFSGAASIGNWNP